MPWRCFVIEEVAPITEYVVICQHRHRTVVEALPNVDFEEAPDAPGDGWPEVCPECAVTLDLDAEPGERAMTSKMGGHIWRRPDTGEEHRYQHEFGPGAMFDASRWAPDNWKGPDGKSWHVVLPPGRSFDIWNMDGPATGGGHWTREGEPPNLTVSPSILTGDYHGFLREGMLTDSLGDRPMEPGPD